MSKLKFLKIFFGLAIIAVVFISANKQIKSQPSKGDIDIYLNASNLFLQGENVYEIPNRGGTDYYVYPPLLAILLIPFLLIRIEALIFIWCVVNIFLIYLLLRMLFAAMTGESLSALPEKSRVILIFLPVLLDLRFILHHLDYGQANILSYTLAVFGLWLTRKNNVIAGGAAIGISMVTKVLTLPFGIWFLAKRNFKAAAGIGSGVIAGLFLPALVLGWQHNLFYLDYWLKTIILNDSRRSQHWALGINFSMQAQLARFFSDVPAFDFHGQSYSLTIFSLAPETVKLLGLAVLFAVAATLAVYAWKFRNHSPLVSQWGGIALTFCLIPIFSPVALKHHFVALLPAYFYVVYLWHCRKLRDRLFIASIVSSFFMTTITSENFWGKDLNNFFLAAGCLSWGTLFLAAAIWRAANCLAQLEKDSPFE
jgi:Glycosyltransferase family 87